MVTVLVCFRAPLTSYPLQHSYFLFECPHTPYSGNSEILDAREGPDAGWPSKNNQMNANIGPSVIPWVGAWVGRFYRKTSGIVVCENHNQSHIY